MEQKILKTVITELTPTSVNILVSCGDKKHEIILPTDIIDPQISLQLAGAISSSPKIIQKNETDN